ncbi:hypothetical protein F2Q68_00019258 [Brassica cretica]|uniref:Trehalose 6-phosphate phosphatase n=1 Tax=Brassica cretica TaxID=69181 RepID=A0A8S9FR32_BRACR|nr:hypothetical protein F2Q68_00019258 [Brassica cretica]
MEGDKELLATKSCLRQSSKWFGSCANLGISAEHGYFTRWNSDSPWETTVLPTDLGWKKIAEPVMSHYTEATDGSFIEEKESAMVWHHQEADPSFGSWQAKELLDHLESVLTNEPVVVKRGQHIVEVKPQGVSKGKVVEHLIATMRNSKGKRPDFLLCIGDDRSDEDMFDSIVKHQDVSPIAFAEVFACTVGQKPSKAKFYLDDTPMVINMLEWLASASDKSKDEYLELGSNLVGVALSPMVIFDRFMTIYLQHARQESEQKYLQIQCTQQAVLIQIANKSFSIYPTPLVGGSFPFAWRIAVKRTLHRASMGPVARLDSWKILVSMPSGEVVDPPYSLKPAEENELDQGLDVGVDAPLVAKSYEGVFYNYLSIGMDAQVAYGFHHLRNTKPYLAQGPISNKLIYSGFSCTQGWFCTPFASDPGLRGLRNILKIHIKKVYCSEWEEIAVPKNVRSVVALNLESYGSGSHPWGNLKPDYLEKRGFVEAHCDDGLIEIFAFKHGWHASFVMTELISAKHIAQAAAVRFELRGGDWKDAFLQMDGEPWKQPMSTDYSTFVEIKKVPFQSLMINWNMHYL